MRSHAAADVVGRDIEPRDAAVSSSWRGQVKHPCSKQVCPPCHASPHGSCDVPCPIKSHCAAVGCKVAQFRCRYAPWMLQINSKCGRSCPFPLPPASLSGVWCAEGPANAHSVQLGRVIPLFSIVFRCSYFFLSGTRPHTGFVGFKLPPTFIPGLFGLNTFGVHVL